MDQLHYTKQQNKYNKNMNDLKELINISNEYKLLKRLNKDNIDFLNHYLILSNCYILRSDCFYFQVENELKKMDHEYKNIYNYYNDLLKLNINNKPLINERFIKYFDSRIKFIDILLNKYIVVPKNSFKIMNNYIKSLN